MLNVYVRSIDQTRERERKKVRERERKKERKYKYSYLVDIFKAIQSTACSGATPTIVSFFLCLVVIGDGNHTDGFS